MSNASLVWTKDLSVGYRSDGKKNVLFEKLNTSLNRGQLVCFMGPNGIGKSTLIRTLTGLQKPLQGDVHYAEEGDTKGKRLPLKISVVLTDRIYANLTAQEVITYGRYPYLTWNLTLTDHDKQVIGQSMDYLRIKHLADKKVFELSDGQMQMVMIARTLAQDTPVILMDEPTAHLDLNNRVEIMNLLRMIAHEKQKAILVATHELDLALQTADLIWLTGNNKDIITGIPEDLVLNDSFDSIFRFKGFDLKTGKVQHALHQKISVHLSGQGHPYLWTKNALERNGYRADDLTSSVKIIIEDGVPLTWQLNNIKDTVTAASLEELIKKLQTLKEQ